jgi:ribokinase
VTASAQPAVFGLGQCSFDHLLSVGAYPPPDSKCEFSEMKGQGGGPVATALVALSRWGVPCVFAGVVGDDEYGTAIRRSLETEGIDLGGLVLRPGSGSQVAFIVAEPGRQTRTVFWRRPTGAPLSVREVDLRRVARARVFHTDGLMIEAALAAADVARRSGARVVVDAGTLREGMLELARLSDVYVASESFARALVGGDDPAAACRELGALGPVVAGVTLGARGYVAIEDGRLLRGDAYPADVVDTTGCGDVFHAGLSYGLVAGWSTETTLDFAAWAASRVATRLGGRDGIPPLSAYAAPRRR